jgi:integrase
MPVPPAFRKYRSRGVIVKLVESSIARLTVPAGQRDAHLWDETLPGFGVRAFSSGKKSFIVKYQLASGQQRKLSLGPALAGTLAETRRKAQDILAKARMGRDVQGEKQAARIKKTSSAGALVTRYLEARRPELRPRTFREVDRHLAMLFADLHVKQIDSLARRDVVEIVDKIAAENGRATADRARTSLATFFAWCMERDFIDSNPAMGIKRRASSKPRERVLTEQEIAAIWNATGGFTDYDNIVRLLLLTGQRRDEIGALVWDEINLDQRQIELQGLRTKNHRDHTVPLSEPALLIIQSVHQRKGRDYLFGIGTGPFSGWSKSKQRLDERLGDQVAPWILHDLRRTFATIASDHDFAPVHAIEMALNHWSGTKSGIVAVYNKAKYDRERRQLMDRWAGHMLKLADGFA